MAIDSPPRQPRTYRDFVDILRVHGADIGRTRGSHEQWVFPSGHAFTLPSPSVRHGWNNRRDVLNRWRDLRRLLARLNGTA